MLTNWNVPNRPMFVALEHRHPDGRTVRYKVMLRCDPWGRQTPETDDLNLITPAPYLEDFAQWTTSARIECGHHILPVLQNATVREITHAKSASRFVFENTPLMWRDTEWFLNSYIVLSEFVSTFSCHVCSSSYVYDDALAAHILRRCAVAYTGWKRVRDILSKRSIVLYWHELTTHQMAVGGAAYVRDHQAFEDEFTMRDE